MRIKTSLLTAALLAVAATSASAATTTPGQNFNVKVKITSTCSISTTVTDVDFGTKDSAQTNVTANGGLSVTCTKKTPYDIGLNAGATTGATVTTRAMKGTGTNTDTVPYYLYSNSALSANWGSTVGTDTLAGTGTGNAQSITVYGKLPSTNYTADSYSDTVTATVTY